MRIPHTFESRDKLPNINFDVYNFTPELRFKWNQFTHSIMFFFCINNISQLVRMRSLLNEFHSSCWEMTAIRFSRLSESHILQPKNKGGIINLLSKNYCFCVYSLLVCYVVWKKVIAIRILHCMYYTLETINKVLTMIYTWKCIWDHTYIVDYASYYSSAIWRQKNIV